MLSSFPLSEQTILLSLLRKKSERQQYARFMDELRQNRDIELHDIDNALRSLVRKGYVIISQSGSRYKQKPGSITLKPEFRKEWEASKRPPQARKWQECLSTAFPQAGEALRGACDKLPDMPTKEIGAIVQCLERYLADIRVASHLPAYVASARYFQGSAKMLDALSPVVSIIAGNAARQGLPTRCLLVYGGMSPGAFTLVENRESWEIAARLFPDQAWCCCYGFSLSSLTYDMLAHVKLFSVNGCRTLPVRELFNIRPLYFWGDLDPAGMQIFEALRTNFPEIGLSPLYNPMAERLKSGDLTLSHGYNILSDKRDQRIDITVLDRQAQEMVDLCAHHRRAVDQEALTEEEILRYGWT